MAIDWDKARPAPEIVPHLRAVKSEDEFPDTYSGQSWRAAYRIWKEYEGRAADLDAIGPYDVITCLMGMDLSGFMAGWAVNAVRQMLGRSPGGNGAIVDLTPAGGRNPVTPAIGTAEEDMRRAIGGETEN